MCLTLGTHGADEKQNPLIMRIQFYMRNRHACLATFMSMKMGYGMMAFSKTSIAYIRAYIDMLEAYFISNAHLSQARHIRDG